MYKITWDKETGGVLLHSHVVEGTLGISPRPVFFEEQRRSDGVASDLLWGSVITFDSFFFMQKVSISEKRTIFAKHEFATSLQR